MPCLRSTRAPHPFFFSILKSFSSVTSSFDTRLFGSLRPFLEYYLFCHRVCTLRIWNDQSCFMWLSLKPEHESVTFFEQTGHDDTFLKSCFSQFLHFLNPWLRVSVASLQLFLQFFRISCWSTKSSARDRFTMFYK